MAVLELILSALLSTLFTIPTMLVLYHAVIIPRILAGVKQELPPAIITIVDEKIGAFKEYVAEQFDSARMAIIGKAGNQKRILGYAARFFEKNGVTPDTVEAAIDKYGEDLVKALSERAAKKDGQNESPWS